MILICELVSSCTDIFKLLDTKQECLGVILFVKDKSELIEDAST